MRKKIFFIISVIMTAFLLSGCLMNLLNLNLPDGIYIGYSKNNNLPSDTDILTYDASESVYYKAVNTSDLVYQEIKNDNDTFFISYYTIYIIDKDGNRISSSVPVLKRTVDDNNLGEITVYADISKIKNGLSLGIGDTTKLYSDWYLRGGFNSWAEGKMTKNGNKFIYSVTASYKEGDIIEYKISPSDSWKPWQFIYNGEIYSNSSENTKYTVKKDTEKIDITFSPLTGTVEITEN